MNSETLARSNPPVQPPIPRARGLPLVGVLPALLVNLIGTLRKFRAKHGDLVSLRILRRRAYLLSDPEAVREVLTAGEPHFDKGPLTSGMRAVFGESLALASGAAWKRRRKLLQPLFLYSSIQLWHPIIASSVGALVRDWETKARGEVIDGVAASSRLIQTIMARMMFGTDLPIASVREAGDAAERVNETLLGQFFRTLTLRGRFKGLPAPGRRKFAEAAAAFDQVIEKILEAPQTGDAVSLINQFRNARYEDTGEAMTRKELRDEVAAFFFAGQETTASALAWALYYLALHPAVANRVSEEARAAYAGPQPIFEDLSNLPFTRQVIDETLRLRSPAYALERWAATEHSSVCGRRLEKDSLVILAPSVTHLHPRHWPEPDRFDPERFSAEGAKGRHPFAFFPFGGGARKCIGMPLAIMELTTAISMIARSFELSLHDGAVVREKIGVTLKPRSTIPLRITPRGTPKSAMG